MSYILGGIKMGRYQERQNYNKKLEPRGDLILHGAGQSEKEFINYYNVIGENKPLIYMTYCGLKKKSIPEYFNKLKRILEGYEELLIPQIGLSMTSDGKPENHYEHLVAQGEYDQQIEKFAAGLKYMERPCFVRIGYEFNGHWNGYEPETYKQAWQRIVDKFREKDLNEVATVWCFEPEGDNKDYMSFYPGDTYVDWWSIDTFAPEHFYMDITVDFMKDAEKHGFPVMIGESTPRGIGVRRGEENWQEWFVNYFRFIEVNPGIKCFCYINRNWFEFPRWPDWGDARLEANEYIKNKFREKIASSYYLHGGNKEKIYNKLNI